eukprot:TRINITY_DN7403_c0_g1_i1.p1 TRINITY_DN7403_c0_g1~~TRINITY_DN7403_c0_g1_i1.p1  ORF type:complete len:756 (-),score=183.44 TRINITY_DN7403_c0_g1_i1:24-2291(-)
MTTRQAKTLEETWNECQKPFQTILVDLQSGLDRKKYMDLYTTVFQYVCSANAETEELYLRVKELLRTRAGELVKMGTPLPDEQLLDFFVKRWNEWSLSCKVLDHIMAYLNRTWVKNQRQSNTPDVYEIIMISDITWRDRLFLPLKERLTKALLRLIQKDRDGEMIEAHLIRDCLQCYVRLGLNMENPKEFTLDMYKEHFEAEFLHGTEIYYTIEASAFIPANGICEFMKRIQERLDQEEGRVSRYLHASTRDVLITRLDSVLIDKHKEIMWQKFAGLLTEDKTEDMALMFSLLSRISGGLDTLRSTFEKHVKQVGLDEIQKDVKEASEKPQIFVQILLRVFRKYTELIKVAFKQDAGFVAAMDKAFRDFINSNAVVDAEVDKTTGSKAPHILSKYCDIILKKGPLHITDEQELENTLNDIVSLFKYLADKDVFMLVYSKLLSKRLISDLSASEDAEGSMITKLKAAQGFEYCMKLQRMIQDMSVSKDINTEFSQYLENKSLKLSFAFTIFVLATGSWPLNAPPSNFNIPNEVTQAVNYFKGFYESKYQGRKLTYLHNLARAEVDSRQAKGKVYKLSVSTYQMGCLLPFNNSDTCTKRDIQDATLLQDLPLKTALLGLIKTKVIDCDAEDCKTWDENTKFMVNLKFASKKLKVACNVPVVVDDQKSTGGATSDVSKQEIEQDRVFKLRAAIVRIMKARKVLSHNEVVAETTAQVSRWFTPRITTIKKVIEYLIDQDYIKRSTDDASAALKKYEYVA